MDKEEKEKDVSVSYSEEEENERKAEKKAFFPLFQKNYKPKSDSLRSVQLSIEKINKSKPKKKRSLLGKDSPGMCQTLIDAGQKKFGPRICDDCGLLYCPGSYEDEQHHKRQHAKLDNLYSFKLWKDPPPRIMNFCTQGGFIIMVQPQNENKKVLKKLKDFITWVDSELSIYFDGNDVIVGDRIFIHVIPTKKSDQVRIIGFLRIEIIDNSKVNAYNIGREEGSIDNQTPTQQISIGIIRLWSESLFRRKKIAYNLCDVARLNCGIPGYIVPKDKIGILEPSASGTLFMKNYTENSGAFYTYSAP